MEIKQTYLFFHFISFQALLHADSLQRTHQVALALQQRAELLVRSVFVCIVLIYIAR